MKKLTLILAAAITLLVANFAQAQEKNYNELCVHRTLKCDGFVRDYWVYIPDDMPEGAPMIVCMHGYSSKYHKRPGFQSFMKLADREKFAVIVPAALGGDDFGYGWNVGYCFQFDHPEFSKKVDDVKFITRMIRACQKEYKLSKGNVFATGASNGGEMCYHFAYLKPRLFKAYAPQFGLTMTWLYKSVSPPKAVPLVELHGTADNVSEWGGDPSNRGGWGEYISVPLAVTQFAIKAHCTHEICEKITPISPESTRDVYLHKYLGGDNGIEVWLYEIVGAGHGGFGKEIDMAECVWEFFKKYL